MKTKVETFWRYIDSANFDGLRSLMTEDAQVWLPNTREVIRGREAYITFNKAYPGRWHATLENVVVSGDTVVSIAKVSGNDMSFYATFFFTFAGGLICEMSEYWSENGEPPQWRADGQYSQTY